MVAVDLKGVHRVQSNGRTYYYAWRGGPRIAGEPGTPEFLASFSELKSPLANADRRKLRTWVALYKDSDDFKGLAATTKRVWLPWFDHINDEFGDLSIRQFDRPTIRVDIRKWRDKWRATPRAADTGKQVLSRVLTHAVAEGAVTVNPCAGIPNLYESDRSEIIWSADDLAQLLAHASIEVGYVARLAALTGFRQGDLLSLSWGHVGKNAIEIKTSKSRKRRRASVPITQEIRDLLETIPKRSTRILTNSASQPWRGFSSSWNDTMIRAELSERDLHFHDFRGTAATNFYRAGFSIREIAQTMGWSEEKVERLINMYVKKDEIMADRIRRIESFTRGG